MDRELPVMAALALAVGLALAILINSFAGASGPDGEELRRAADRPPADVAALRLTPRPDRPATPRQPRRRAAAHRRPRRHTARTVTPAGAAPAATVRAPESSYPADQGPPPPAAAPRPTPKPAPQPAPKHRPGTGGAAQPFDDSG